MEMIQEFLGGFFLGVILVVVIRWREIR